MSILKRLGWVIASPFLLIAFLLYYILGVIGSMTVGAIWWLLFGNNIILDFLEGRMGPRYQIRGGNPS